MKSVVLTAQLLKGRMHERVTNKARKAEGSALSAQQKSGKGVSDPWEVLASSRADGHSSGGSRATPLCLHLLINKWMWVCYGWEHPFLFPVYLLKFLTGVVILYLLQKQLRRSFVEMVIEANEQSQGNPGKNFPCFLHLRVCPCSQEWKRVKSFKWRIALRASLCANRNVLSLLVLFSTVF